MGADRGGDHANLGVTGCAVRKEDVAPDNGSANFSPGSPLPNGERDVTPFHAIPPDFFDPLRGEKCGSMVSRKGRIAKGGGYMTGCRGSHFPCAYSLYSSYSRFPLPSPSPPTRQDGKVGAQIAAAITRIWG